jgi:hypothetical protein
LTRDIIRDAQKTMFPHSGSDSIELKGLPAMKPHLQERDEIRSSKFKVDGFGAEHFTRSEDVHYTAIDITAVSSRGQRAFAAASIPRGFLTLLLGCSRDDLKMRPSAATAIRTIRPTCPSMSIGSAILYFS